MSEWICRSGTMTLDSGYRSPSSCSAWTSDDDEDERRPRRSRRPTPALPSSTSTSRESLTTPTESLGSATMVALAEPVTPARWMYSLRDRLVLANSIAWIDPHTTSDDAETVYEWWKGDRKLSAYISNGRVELIRVWGINIDTEMESIIDPADDALLKAWRWLLG
jgi:hypothetical protein